MFRGISVRALFVPVVVVCLAGCGNSGGGAGGGVLNRLGSLPDTDNDGLPEVEPPAGVEFDTASSVELKITNTITRNEALAASGASLPGAVASSVDLSVAAAITLTYADGTEQVLRGTFPLGPEELAFEAACPESVEVLVTAIADTPVTTPQAVATFGPFGSGEGNAFGTFACGAELGVETSANGNGELVASVIVE